MDASSAVDTVREALITSLIIGSPMLAVAIAVGLIVGLLQALTNIQDQSIAFVAKFVAVGATLALCLPWLISRMLEYAETVFTTSPTMIVGG